MSISSSIIAALAMPMNKRYMEGVVYHDLADPGEFLSDVIRSSIARKQPKLRYLGYKTVAPPDEAKRLAAKTTAFDIAVNQIYPVEYFFQYGTMNNETFSFIVYLPVIGKFNTVTLSDNTFVVTQTFADKVVSVGDNIVFVDIATAKYNFTRTYYPISVDGDLIRTPVIWSALYKNQSKKVLPTTKALTTVLNYLIAAMGYEATALATLGFIPEVFTDESFEYLRLTQEERDAFVWIYPSGTKPSGVISKEEYRRSPLVFRIRREDWSPQASMFMGNLLYLIDNFPSVITEELLRRDHETASVSWKSILGEIIHSGNNTVQYVWEKIAAHFADLTSGFGMTVIARLGDIGIRATNLIELMLVIFNNFSGWISDRPNNNYFNNKVIIKDGIMQFITFPLSRAFLELSKEELRSSGEVDWNTAKRIMAAGFPARQVFRVKKTPAATNGSALSPNNIAWLTQSSSMVRQMRQQQSTVPKSKGGKSNLDDDGDVRLPEAIIGSIHNLKKGNPSPFTHMNPYIAVSSDGTVITPEGCAEEISRQDAFLRTFAPDDLMPELTSGGLEETIEEIDA